VVQPKVLGPGCVEITPMLVQGTSLGVSLFQAMGDRRTQEDRFIVVPSLDPESRKNSPCAFFGVFDGTVGDFASENVKELVLPKLIEVLAKLFDSSSLKALRNSTMVRPNEQERIYEAVMKDLYRSVDDALLVRCAREMQHYATCTSVTLMVAGDFLVCAHLGDSRIVLGKEVEGGNGELVGEQLTMDHKPDLEHERARIEQCGGMVEKLHNRSNKPFIRGGDFLMRKSLGEQPMQLQYSRAFGAKDLKIFGLSSVPDVKIIRMGSPSYKNCRVAILASDGLWDVVSAQQAVTIAQQAAQSDLNPAEALVRMALLEQSRRKARADNITALCVMFG